MLISLAEKTKSLQNPYRIDKIYIPNNYETQMWLYIPEPSLGYNALLPSKAILEKRIFGQKKNFSLGILSDCILQYL